MRMPPLWNMRKLEARIGCCWLLGLLQGYRHVCSIPGYQALCCELMVHTWKRRVLPSTPLCLARQHQQLEQRHTTYHRIQSLDANPLLRSASQRRNPAARATIANSSVATVCSIFPPPNFQKHLMHNFLISKPPVSGLSSFLMFPPLSSFPSTPDLCSWNDPLNWDQRNGISPPNLSFSYLHLASWPDIKATRNARSLQKVLGGMWLSDLGQNPFLGNDKEG